MFGTESRSQWVIFLRQVFGSEREDDDPAGDWVHLVGNAITFEDIEPMGRPFRGGRLSAACRTRGGQTLDDAFQLRSNRLTDRRAASTKLSLDVFRYVQSEGLHGHHDFWGAWGFERMMSRRKQIEYEECAAEAFAKAEVWFSAKRCP